MNEYPYGMIVAAVLGIISVFLLARQPSSVQTAQELNAPAAVTYAAPAVMNAAIPQPGQFPAQASAPPPPAMMNAPAGVATAVPIVPPQFQPRGLPPGAPFPGPHNPN